MSHVEWKPVFVLPNIKIENAIGGDEIVLAPAHDQRVEDIGRQHSKFKDFLQRFCDAFGVSIEPTVLLARADAPERLIDIRALAGFRDLVAHSVIAYARARWLAHPHLGSFRYGDSFAFYPWMLDKNFENLTTWTPALSGLHEVEKFGGQSSPEIPSLWISASDLDLPLFEGLLKYWRRWYRNETPEWKEVALFRSLNMALHASKMPTGSDAYFLDQGRLIALWVSAFEILVHPETGQANLWEVFDLLERVPWSRSECRERRHPTKVKGKKDQKEDRTLGSWLYEILYERRCDFLHGNPVSPLRLLVPSTERSILEYAAPLYRLALTAFLPLELGVAQPSVYDDPTAVGTFLAKRMSFMEKQETFEDALLTSRPG